MKARLVFALALAIAAPQAPASSPTTPGLRATTSDLTARTAVPARPEDLAAVAGTWQLGLVATSSAGQRVTPQVTVRVDAGRVFVRTPQLPSEEEWWSDGPGRFFSPTFDQQIVLPDTPGGALRLFYFGSALELRK